MNEQLFFDFNKSIKSVKPVKLIGYFNLKDIEHAVLCHGEFFEKIYRYKLAKKFFDTFILQFHPGFETASYFHKF